jgi:hypothetical protein
LIEPNIDQLATGLTDRDLVFPSGDNYKFAAQEPFTKTELERIGPQTRNVFVSLGLPPDQYVEISNAMLRAPSARLRIRGYNPYLDPDLDCLKYFCHLRRIVFEHFQHGDLEALRQLSPDLISLEIHFAASKKERASLAPLQHFKALKSLALIGHYEDLSRFPNLYSLEALLLSEVSIKDLSSLAAQKRLRSLVLHRSKIKDVSALSSLYRLQYLALAALPELASVEAMTGLDNLEYLELSYLPKIEGLPSLSKLSRLRRVDIVALKSSRDLKPIMDAPTLQHLYLGEMKQLESGDLYCIAQHPTVKGFDTDNLAFEKALGLPRIGPTKHFTFTEVPPMRPEPAMEAMNVSSSQKPEASDEESGETPPEELRIHFALNSWFGSSDELLECHDLEERLQQMIEGDLVGRWDGQEVGAGFYSVFMVGPSTEAMYECIRNELLLSAPKGSYVELEDAEGDLIRSIQLPTLSEKAT